MAQTEIAETSGRWLEVLRRAGEQPDRMAVNHVHLPLAVSRWIAATLLVVFFVLLIGLPLAAASVSSQGLKRFDAFYRAASPWCSAAAM